MVIIIILTALSPVLNPSFLCQFVSPYWDPCHFSWIWTTTTDKDVAVLLHLYRLSHSLACHWRAPIRHSHRLCHIYVRTADGDLLFRPSFFFFFTSYSLFMTLHFLPPNCSLHHPTYYRCLSCLFPTNALRSPRSLSTYNLVWPAEAAAILLSKLLHRLFPYK